MYSVTPCITKNTHFWEERIIVDHLMDERRRSGLENGTPKQFPLFKRVEIARIISKFRLLLS